MNPDNPIQIAPGLRIRLCTEEDFAQIWPFFRSIIQAEETYAFDPAMSEEQARHLWLQLPLKTYVVEQDGLAQHGSRILASYYIKANAAGPGSHVCNCGYMVSSAAQGMGLARQMCEHSQQVARALGFQAMQFNSVVSSNKVAVQLWQKLGFEIVGTLPKAYRSASLGLVDAYVMYKWL
ncbi:GNAT family N-acetyltransferase [Pokkaliibacter sp. MBI-7]|uniref:GNAT family N-acetyltransferase n=1 Tax=Pokkaliibacter sp. MBI-7 TaxID=3040600 RepID=UPI00244C5044|nr:GNAT family N-acetyltransferase [Pokkaliibacter sp. MBI-7]MDH2432462.1 GNAT family N-acetyltransferase [Pokkaliibacter sp. MBI-7]